MESGNSNTVLVSSHLTLLQLLGAFMSVVFPLAAGALYFVKWNVEHTVAGIHREIESNSSSAKEKIAALEYQLEILRSGLDSSKNKIDVDKVSSDAVKDDVGNVKNEVVEVKDEVVDVKSEVTEVRAKVDEMSSDIDDTSEKIKLVRAVLGNAFKDNPEILLQLTDDRLSESLPFEFFGEEPRTGAALPEVGADTQRDQQAGTQNQNPVAPGRKSIARYCHEQQGPTLTCYQNFLQKYEHRQMGERNNQ